MLFEHYFEHSSKCTNLVFQLLNSPSVEKTYSHCRQSTYCIWFCSDNFHCWVFLPGMGLFNQQFLKTTFAFSNMWQLRIWYLDIDVLLATNELFFNMLLRAWMHGEKNWTAQRQLETLFIHAAASQSLVPNQIVLRKKHPVEFHFKDIGRMSSSTKKCDDDETSSFCVAFGGFCSFLKSTFLPLKHHQPCTLLQSASHLQLSIGAFAKTKPQKLLDPTNLYESVFCSVCFFESTPSG